jgi:ABC-type sugar transport system substrate-binding protein
MGEERNVCKVLVGKPEGRPRRRREDGFRMYLREIGWRSVEWIQLAQDRDWWQALVSAVMNLWVLEPQS